MDPIKEHSSPPVKKTNIERESTMVGEGRRFEGLSFVQPKDGSQDDLNMWVVSRSGDWTTDNRQGREHAKALIGYMKAHHAPQLLGYVVQAMSKGKEFGGVEVGFFAEISSRIN